MYISVKDGRLQKVAFEMDGCLNTAACANTVAELVEGRDLETAWKISPEMVAAFLETLPADHFHCAELAVGAFFRALTDCRQHAPKAWQPAYRKPA
jgi:nitrogen fixation NifU-like protein